MLLLLPRVNDDFRDQSHIVLQSSDAATYFGEILDVIEGQLWSIEFIN